MNTLQEEKIDNSVNNTELYDLVIIGGGFRTTTFLASNPELLDYKIQIVERKNELGPGAFGEYTVTTSSAGANLLRNIRFQGPFEVLKNNKHVNSVSNSKKPVRTEELASALRAIGSVITEALKDSILLNSEVKHIELNSNEKLVFLQLGDGTGINARHALLATGRRERPHQELEPWREKVLLSSTVISSSYRNTLIETLKSLNKQPIVIAGCSHSAMSALTILLEVINQIKQEQPNYCSPPIYVLQRSLTKLMYESQDEACMKHVLGRELFFDADKDMCPDTGIVFRDSGLRHKSKELYCSLWAGKVVNCQIVKAKTLREEASLLDRAGLIVQALGYHGEAPDIFLDGALIRPSLTEERFLSDGEGAALIREGKVEYLSLLRLEPTPINQRDNASFGKNLYQQLAIRIIEQLSNTKELSRTAHAFR